MVEKVNNILRRVNEDILNYKGKDMVDDGIIDSLEIMEIVSDIEKEFHIEMSADDIVMENFQTLETICKLIQRKVNKEKSEENV